MTTHVAFGGKLVGVDDIEVGFLLGKEMLHAVWHGSFESGIVHIGVEKEGTTNLKVVDDIELEESSETKKLIEKFVDENPEAVANLLRNWLNEGWE